MQEPTETIIVQAYQNFETVGGPNPTQIEIKDDRILNTLKKIQKCHLQYNSTEFIVPSFSKN